VKLTPTSLLQLEWWVFSISYISWVLANIMTESSHWFQKCDRNSGHSFYIRVCPDFGLIFIYLSTPTMRSWWSPWVVMAAHYCYSKRVTVWHFVCNSHKVMTALFVNCLPFVVVDISLQFHRYLALVTIWSPSPPHVAMKWWYPGSKAQQMALILI
jgi:hypothetical protein